MELLGERILRVEDLEDQCNDMRRVFRSQLEEAVRQLEGCRRELQGLREGGGLSVGGCGDAGKQGAVAVGVGREGDTLDNGAVEGGALKFARETVLAE